GVLIKPLRIEGIGKSRSGAIDEHLRRRGHSEAKNRGGYRNLLREQVSIHYLHIPSATVTCLTFTDPSWARHQVPTQNESVLWRRYDRFVTILLRSRPLSHYNSVAPNSLIRHSWPRPQ